MRSLMIASSVLCLFSCVGGPIRPESSPKLLTGMVYIESDYDTVWERFTRAESFADWYTAPCRTFGTEPGDELVWAEGDREVYRGRLLRAQKGSGLAWEFRFVGFGFDEPMTRLDIEILERGETVLVKLSHDVTGAPMTEEIISPVGWAKPLSRLKTLIETGTAMTWPEESS